MSTIDIGGGKTAEFEPLNTTEDAIFETEWPFIVERCTRYTRDPNARNVLTEVFDNQKTFYKRLCCIAKAEIDQAGSFGGMNPTVKGGGFGWQPIRPDYLVEDTVVKTWFRTTAALTSGNWYGLWHNGDIGAAFNATPLYNRKVYLTAIAALWDAQETGLFQSVKFEIENSPQSVFVCRDKILSDLPIFQLPAVQVIRPRNQYRVQYQAVTAGGNMEIMPLGITFAKKFEMENTAPTGNTTVAP